MHKRASVYLINFEHLSWLKRYLRGNFTRFPVIFVDESSLIKNPKSARFKVLEDIKDTHIGTVTFVPMTGTPQPQSIMDLYTQVYLVDGGERLGATFNQFRARFFKPGKKLAKHVYEWEPEQYAFDQIKEAIADITIELSDEEKKKFPVVEVPHWIDLPKKVREQYDLLEEGLVS